MKKIFLPLFIVTYAVILSGIWIFQTGSIAEEARPVFTEYFYVGIISIFFLIGIYIGYKRIKRKKAGMPEEDEMSRKIAQKAAATSFYISLFLWLGLIYLQDRILTDIRLLFGYGMLGMALIFVFSWFFYSFKGVIHE
jgi:hypothetical protein